MPQTFRLVPTQPVPDLALSLVNDTKWLLSSQKPKSFSLLVFYRGLHCPVCRTYLQMLSSKITSFTERGVECIAISMDDETRSKKAYHDWDLQSLPVGYGLSRDNARHWGLYLSAGRGKTELADEPALFSEPGLFLIRPDQTLYFSSIQTMPFARPEISGVLTALDYILKHKAEPRGDIVEAD